MSTELSKQTLELIDSTVNKYVSEKCRNSDNIEYMNVSACEKNFKAGLITALTDPGILSSIKGDGWVDINIVPNDSDNYLLINRYGCFWRGYYDFCSEKWVYDKNENVQQTNATHYCKRPNMPNQ